jgi:hypothetical protein
MKEKERFICLNIVEFNRVQQIDSNKNSCIIYNPKILEKAGMRINIVININLQI